MMQKEYVTERWQRNSRVARYAGVRRDVSRIAPTTQETKKAIPDETAASCEQEVSSKSTTVVNG